MPTQLDLDVVSPEHRVQLDEMAAELEHPDLPAFRRAELLALCDEIAEHYGCDARLCE
jgi:hypothetical protein